MNCIDFSDLKHFRDRARKHISSHPDYKFYLKHDYVCVRDNTEKIYCAHSKYFDIILSEAWRIILKENSSIKTFKQLLRAVWNSEILEKNNQSFKSTLNKNFNEFISLCKKQYFYFGNENEQFLFPLFRIIEDNNDVTGGFFHFLTKHFEKYSNLHSFSNEQTDYLPNDLLRVLIKTSTKPDSTQNKAARNQEDDCVSIRTRVCQYYDRKTKKNESQRFQAKLYFDNNSNLLFITTFHRG